MPGQITGKHTLTIKKEDLVDLLKTLEKIRNEVDDDDDFEYYFKIELYEFAEKIGLNTLVKEMIADREASLVSDAVKKIVDF